MDIREGALARLVGDGRLPGSGPLFMFKRSSSYGGMSAICNKPEYGSPNFVSFYTGIYMVSS